MEQRSPEWFEARKKRLTASMVGGVLGHSPYMTRKDVMRRMIRDALGAEPEFTGNVATTWGEFNENDALLDLRLTGNLIIEKCGFYPYEDWLGASPDGMTSDGDVVEIKCPYGKMKDKNPVFKPISELPHYYDQVQVQLLCTGAEQAWFYQWSPYGDKLEPVSASEEWRDENMPKLRQFYAEFLHELENNADEYLRPKRKEIDTAEAHRMVREWEDLKEQIELLQGRQKDLLSDIVALAGEKDATIAGRKLTNVKRAGSVSYAKVVKDHLPNLDLSPYTGKPSEYWKLS